MTFNELNSVEYFIIHQLSGVNLNADGVAEGQVTHGAQWQYRSPDDLDRGVNEVLVHTQVPYLLRKEQNMPPQRIHAGTRRWYRIKDILENTI